MTEQITLDLSDKSAAILETLKRIEQLLHRQAEREIAWIREMRENRAEDQERMRREYAEIKDMHQEQAKRDIISHDMYRKEYEMRIQLYQQQIEMSHRMASRLDGQRTVPLLEETGEEQA